MRPSISGKDIKIMGKKKYSWYKAVWGAGDTVVNKKSPCPNGAYILARRESMTNENKLRQVLVSSRRKKAR